MEKHDLLHRKRLYRKKFQTPFLQVILYHKVLSMSIYNNKFNRFLINLSSQKREERERILSSSSSGSCSYSSSYSAALRRVTDALHFHPCSKRGQSLRRILSIILSTLSEFVFRRLHLCKIFRNFFRYFLRFPADFINSAEIFFKTA